MFGLKAGEFFGEMGLLSGRRRSGTAVVSQNCVLVETPRRSMLKLLYSSKGVQRKLDEVSLKRVVVSCLDTSPPGSELDYLENVRDEHARDSRAAGNQSSGLINFLMEQGVGEATDVLLIDYARCIRCDNCETSCADAHDGTSRLDREAGATYAQIHVPTSCRHCEHPHCMKDCPPDAIHRSVNGEVYIGDNCIGCGNCQTNCPYDVIQMAVEQEYQKRSLWQVMIGTGKLSGKVSRKVGDALSKKAVKCDMCKDIIGGPVCVRACPTGAAMRVNPEEFLKYAK